MLINLAKDRKFFKVCQEGHGNVRLQVELKMSPGTDVQWVMDSIIVRSIFLIYGLGKSIVDVENKIK